MAPCSMPQAPGGRLADAFASRRTMQNISPRFCLSKACCRPQREPLTLAILKAQSFPQRQATLPQPTGSGGVEAAGGTAKPTAALGFEPWGREGRRPRQSGPFANNFSEGVYNVGP